MLHLNNLAQKIKSMREKFVEQKLVDETTLPAVIDETSDNVEAINKKLRGSILRVSQPSGPKYVVVPAPADPVFAAGATPKIHVAEKWDQLGSSKAMKVATLLSDGLDAGLLGVLSLPLGAGGEAGKLLLGSAPAKLLPPTGAGSGAIKSVNVEVGGASVEKTVDEAVLALGLKWQPWAGRVGGLAAVPAHADLPKLADADSTGLAGTAILGGATGASMALAALKDLGLLDASSQTTAGELAGFLSAAAGLPAAQPMLSIVLAAPNDVSTDTKKLAASWGAAMRQASMDVASALTLPMIQAVEADNAALRRLGFTVSGRQLGEALARSAAASVLAPAAASAPALTPAPTPAPAAAPATALVASATAAPALATGADPFSVRLASLSLDPAVRAAVVAAMGAHPAPAGGAPAPAPAASLALTTPHSAELPFAELRPVGSEALSGEAVLAAIGAAITPAQSASTVIKALAEQRKAGAAPSIFGSGGSVAAEQAAADYAWLLAKAGLSFEGQPASWVAAAERLHRVLLRAGRSGDSDGGGDPMDVSRVRAKASEDDDVQVGWLKPCLAASRTAAHFAVASDLITPLAAASFARSEAVASQPSDPIERVRRLVDMKDGVGTGAAAFIFSDGTVAGGAPKAGIATSVHDARGAFLAWLVQQIEITVGEKRSDAVSEEIRQLADAILFKRCYVSKKGADGTPEVVMDMTCLYPLAVYLLGGQPPTTVAQTDSETLFAGTWGTRVGQQSMVDIPLAMLNLARLLAATDGLAGGGPIGSATPAGGGQDGLGLAALAQRACRTLNSDKVEEMFLDLFRRAQGQAARRRTRAPGGSHGASPVDWPTLVAETDKRKVEPLVAEQRAEFAARREVAENPPLSGRKSPSGGARSGKEEGAEESASKRAKKKQEWKAKQKEEREAEKAQKQKNAAAAAATLAAATPGTQAPAAAAAKSGQLSPNSIVDLTDKVGHKGAVETLQRLYTKKYPERRQREQQPCPFLAIKGACSQGPSGGCVQCKEAQDAVAAGRELPPPFSRELLDEVKAACSERVRKAFRG